MPSLELNNIGAIGLIKDLSPSSIPPEVWSDGNYVRFMNGKLIKAEGERLVFNPPSVAPYWAHFIETTSNSFWVYVGLTAAYLYDMVAGTHTDVTRTVGGAYAGSTVIPITGGILGNMVVWNNGVDDPQVLQVPATTNDFEDLPNWPATHSARAMRPWKTVLVAMDITKGAVRNPQMIRISHPADPGTVPSSWDETDPTKDVIERVLSDAAGGFIIDGAALGDIFVVYKENSTWGIQFIGGRFVYRTFTMFDDSGIIAANCVVPIRNGTHHFVAVRGDLIVHDGRTPGSVLNDKWREFLRADVDSTNFKRSFCVANPAKSEAWFCYPSSGNTVPNRALTWNWENGTIGFRGLKDAHYIAAGPIEDAVPSATWDGSVGSWDADTTIWDKDVFGQEVVSLLQCDPVSTELVKLDEGQTIRGVSGTDDIPAFIERKNLAIVGQDRQGNPVVNPSIIKQPTAIWIRGSGAPITVRVGAQQTIDGPITYSSPIVFDPSNTKVIYLQDRAPAGPYLAIRFEQPIPDTTKLSWEIAGYKLDFELLGEVGD